MVEDQKEECLHCKKCCEPKWKQFVRPSTFILTLFIFFILMVSDGNWGVFNIRDIYLKILESILVTMVIALFASRGVEKTFGIKPVVNNSIASARFSSGLLKID